MELEPVEFRMTRHIENFHDTLNHLISTMCLIRSEVDMHVFYDKNSRLWEHGLSSTINSH